MIDVTSNPSLGAGAVGISLLAASANGITLPILGVPANVVGIALGGALASFAYGRGLPSRGRLFFLAVSNTFLGCMAVLLLPEMLGWKWMRPELQPPLAGAIAFALRWAVPAFVQIAPQWFLNRSNGGGRSDPYDNYPGDYRG